MRDHDSQVRDSLSGGFRRANLRVSPPLEPLDEDEGEAELGELEEAGMLGDDPRVAFTQDLTTLARHGGIDHRFERRPRGGGRVAPHQRGAAPGGRPALAHHPAPPPRAGRPPPATPAGRGRPPRGPGASRPRPGAGHRRASRRSRGRAGPRCRTRTPAASTLPPGCRACSAIRDREPAGSREAAPRRPGSRARWAAAATAGTRRRREEVVRDLVEL